MALSGALALEVYRYGAFSLPAGTATIAEDLLALVAAGLVVALDAERAGRLHPLDVAAVVVLHDGVPESGFDAGLVLRRRLTITEAAPPIIMLSAMGEDTDRIVGLELGADDYVVKPFSPRQLRATVQQLLRERCSTS